MSNTKTIEDISDLTPDPQNANEGTERGLRMLDDSLREDGAGRSILVDRDGVTIAGAKTLERAADIGLPVRVIQTDGTELVVVQRTDLDLDGEGDEQVRARRMAYRDNRSSEVGLSWDIDQLLEDVNAGVDLSGVFRSDEIDELLAEVREAEAAEDPGDMTDRAEELQEKWQVKRGDIWEVDGHFVICGDCREAETWERLLAAAGVDKVNGVFTSPPYAEQRKKQYGGVPVDEYVEWWEAVQENVRANLADDGSFFVNIKPHCEKGERVLYVFDLVLAMKRRWGWRFVDELCWVNPGVPGAYPNRFKDCWEPVFQFGQGKAKFHPRAVGHWSDDTFSGPGGMPGRGGGGSYIPRAGARESGIALPGNVIQTGSGDGGHAAAFPVTLPDFFIRAYSDPGDAWIDPFLGSGTTIVAAHQNERRGLGIELLEKYVSVVLERLAGMGLAPRLLAT